MTSEAVILAICGVLIVLIFLAGDNSILVSFDEATPRLAARIERNIATGSRFYKATDGGRVPNWVEGRER